jgi:hypothetical protein
MNASDHLVLEAQYAIRRGYRPGDPFPLAPGQSVPGCACERCTEIPDARPFRRPLDLPDLDVDAARAVPMTDVAALLDIPHRRGWARCPFHEDRNPSFHLNDRKQAAFCNPCGRSWDGVALLMELRGLSFPDAVKELTR